MKIGIDARLYNETGVGGYIRNLISNLSEIDNKNNYFIYLRKREYDEFIPKNERWQKRLADVQWHTLSEQIQMPQLLMSDNLDLVHFPYFSIPVLYPGKFIITVHDLTITHFDTGRATTLPRPIYRLKRVGYEIVLKTGIRRAKKIIAVSNFTKKEIREHFKVNENKIVVTYEAGNMDERCHPENKRSGDERSCMAPVERMGFLASLGITNNRYFLCVGNAHPHKNLEKLIDAFLSIKNNDFKLVLVGNDNFFYPRLKEYVKEKNANGKIIFTGFVENRDLPEWYQNAYAFIFPSLMEGFGLPALEAMENNCPVLVSDSSSLPEICGDAAIYFDPAKKEEIKNVMEKIIASPTLRKELINKGETQCQKFSWKKMAEETLSVYNEVSNN